MVKQSVAKSGIIQNLIDVFDIADIEKTQEMNIKKWQRKKKNLYGRL